MKKNLILTCCFLLSVLTLHAEKWLPKQHSPAVTMRLLGCQYHQAQLIGLEELTADSPNWRVWQEVDSVQGVIAVTGLCAAAMLLWYVYILMKGDDHT